jgi:hypothetical protein
VVLNGALLAFLAPSGTGKSSLAAALVAGGATLFADDLLAVRMDTGLAGMGYPGTPHLRLPPATWTALESGRLRSVRTDPDGKQVVQMPVPHRTGPHPLAALFLLETGRTLDAQPLTGCDLLLELRRLIARPLLAGVVGSEAAVFTALGQLAARVPAWRVVRPASGWSLDGVATLIRACLTDCPSPSTPVDPVAILTH